MLYYTKCQRNKDESVARQTYNDSDMISTTLKDDINPHLFTDWALAMRVNFLKYDM